VAVLIMGAQRGTLQLLEGDTLRIVAHHGHEPPFLGYFASAERRASACGEALLRGERVIIPDIEKSPVFTGTPSLPVLRAASVRAVQSTPMVNRTGETVGIITTQWDAPNQPGEHDLWRIDLLARQATDLTEQVQAQEALQKSEARFRLLSETAARLLAAEDPQGLIDSLCRQVMEHLDCQAFFNFMVDEREGRLRLNACAGIPGEEVRKLEWLDYGVAVCGCVARDEARIIAEDIFHTPDARTELVKSYGIQAYCCHPLKDQGRLIGTLSFGTKTRAHFTPDEVELMRTVADQVAVALQRIESKRELLETGQRLSLTLDAGGMGAWALDPRSNRVIWNPKMYELLGLPADGGVENPETFFALVHPEDQQGMRGAVADVLARTGLFRQEFRVVRPDGKVLWMASVGRVMTDEAGQPGSFAGVSYDITSRKEREKELGMLNRMLRALSHSSHAQALAEDEKAYLEDVCRIVVRDCGYAMVWIGYAENDEGKTVRPMAHAGFEGGYLETLNLTWADRERGRGPTGTAIREARPVLCADMLTEPRFAPWRDEALNRGYASSLALPLLSEGDAFGAVTVYSREPNPFTKDEVSLLSELAEDLMRGITTLRLREANREARKALQRSKDELEEKVRERTAELTCLLAELEQGRDDLRKLASELVMAEEMERKRIAVTLHDEVAQTLAAAKMRLDMLKNERDPAESQRFFGEARELLGQSIREARALMSDISSPVLYEMGLPSALQALAEQTSAGRGISISYSCSGDPGDLQTEIAVMIYQVVRELLQNIIKHSGARMASIRLTREDHSVRTVVADDGKGFNAADIGSPGRESGFGIFSIRERLKSFGGNVQIESAPGKGTVVTVTLPAKITDGDAAARERRVSAKRGKRGKP
jgi:PAS domain S-box-containing protein